MNDVRTVFMGTAAIACPSLLRLLRWPGTTVVAVVTQPDRPAGRHLHPQPSPVKQLAVTHGVPVLQPDRVRNTTFLQALRELEPDLIVVMAFGQILPPSVLAMPRHGCLNLHASLLPKYRGAAPIQWALIHGETVTGVTLILMDEGLDTGPILAQRTLTIAATETAATLHHRLAALAADLLLETLPGWLTGQITPRPQPVEGVSYAPRLRKEDGRMDWTLTAVELERRIRAFDPWPGAYTWWLPVENTNIAQTHPSPSKTNQGRRRTMLLKLWRAEVVDQEGCPGQVLQVDATGITVACGRGALRLLEVQREGGRRLPVSEFLAGHLVRPGDNLGDAPNGHPGGKTQGQLNRS
ncbi:MAG: methionyl-tRNA formyltransferase [Verrucomicrobiota bacterium]|nr:methionyl-tRNA formyltransferase [Limisphaera sp.]MDW8382767.1 methionyl-tRNA formyltransferase [Verrucomicrobiota bacterium]